MTKSITFTSDDPQWEAALILASAADLLLADQAKAKSKASPPEEPEEEEDDGIDNEEEEDGSYAWEDLTVGMKVLVDFGDDGHVEAEITSMPKKNKAQVQVTPDDTQEAEMVSIDDLLQIIESEEEEGSLEFSPGDDVEFKEGRKKVQGTIKSIDEDKETAKVKVPGTRTLSIVEFDKLALITE